MEKSEQRIKPRLSRASIYKPGPLMAVLALSMIASLLWVTAAVLPLAALAQDTDPPAQSLSELPLSFPVQAPEVAAFFQEIARREDSASFPPDRQFLLPDDTVGQRMVAFRSWSEAREQLDNLSGPIDMVMYNPENWDLTPEEEKQELVSTVREFAAFVHQRDLTFMFAPDRRYAELYLSEVAPDVDAVMLQGQRLQHDPQTFAVWVRGMAEVAHAANPDIQVFVQVGATRGTAQEMLAALDTVAGDIDGIAIWSMPRTLHVLQEFVALLREDSPTPAATATSALDIVPTVSPVTESPTPGGDAGLALPSATPAVTPGLATSTPVQSIVTAIAEISPSSTALSPATPVAQAEPPGQPMGWVTDVLLFAGGVGLGLVLGFALGWSLGRGK